MQFPTKICGIPCLCKVLEYTPDKPTQVYGPAMEDANPPEEGTFDFEILTSKGSPASWLERMLTPEIVERLREEVHVMYQAEVYAQEAASEFDPRYDEEFNYVDGI